VTEVVTFGESMAALRGEGPLRLGGTMHLSVAGAESNVAIGLARLGHSVRWIGRVGYDELGQLVRRTLNAEGVITSAITDPDRLTGLILFEPRLADVVRVHYYRSGSAGSAISGADVLDALGSGVQVLHVTGVTAALSEESAKAVHAATQHAHELGILVSFDINYRARLWTPETARQTLRGLIPAIDVVFASEPELEILAPRPGGDATTVARQLIADGVETVVIKRGEQGAKAHTGRQIVTAPARKVRVIDVIGAGDAFVAGYLSGTLDGLDLTARLDRATAVGAFAVASQGDWEGLPTRDELHLLDAEDAAIR
jgi:2-dehydro-3-deoxygluconokinase